MLNLILLKYQKEVNAPGTPLETVQKVPLRLQLRDFGCNCVRPPRRIFAYTASSSVLVSHEIPQFRYEEDFLDGFLQRQVFQADFFGPEECV